jgi:hypothetical protein
MVMSKPHAFNARPLVSMISTAELSRRPSRLPDYAAENRALVALAQALATAPDSILQKLTDTALTLCRAHSAGFSFLEDAKARFPLARHRGPVDTARGWGNAA